MKTLYYSAEIRFKPRTSQTTKKEVIQSLELATEHKWIKVTSSKYQSDHFDIMSNLKIKIVYLIIKEVKIHLEEFRFILYYIKDMPDKIVQYKNNKLTYIK